jgi:hypothetical protein
VIPGRNDTFFTVEEFAGMIKRSEKTVQNWASDGRLHFVYLCGVPLISMAMVESLIAGKAPDAGPAAEAALRAIGRRDRDGLRTEPDRHRRQRRMTGESASGVVLLSSEPPVGSSPS